MLNKPNSFAWPRRPQHHCHCWDLGRYWPPSPASDPGVWSLRVDLTKEADSMDSIGEQNQLICKIYMCIDIYVNIYIYNIHVCMYISIYIQIYLYLYTYKNMCPCVMYVFIRMCIHINHVKI